MQLRKNLFILLLTFIAPLAYAQKAPWPPEVSALYIQARDYLAANKLQQAIITYKQAIAIMPANMLLYRDLAKAYYSAHLYEDAEKTLKPIIESKDADDQCYQVMAMSLLAENKDKKARHTLEDGIDRFPTSGLLYHDLGKWYENNNDPEVALSQWLRGIEHDPVYHLNYYEAAQLYSHTSHPVWVIVYGETFINMEQETPRSYDTRRLVLDAYRKLFGNMVTAEIPEYGGGHQQVSTFEEAVCDVYRKLTPLVKDGINLGSITSLRTQFLRDWDARYASQFPYDLFRYEDSLLRGDYFDIYDQWLFGKVLDEKRYASWKAENAGALDALNNWFGSHKLHPAANHFYNDKNTKGLLLKPKQ